MNVHTLDELRQFQAMPLQVKVAMTQTRIRAWVNEFGVDGVYVSFSGGKDSTVLLHIVRDLYPEIPAVFIDTGLEYPEVREFVKTIDNVVWLKPEMNFKEVIKTYGYPVISKDVSKNVYYAKAFINGETKADFHYKKMMGEINDKEGEKSRFNSDKYKFLLNAPFKISYMCCNIMKKNPAYAYGKKTGRVPIPGQMTEESRLRQRVWETHGCNSFDAKHPVSNPMAFWTEQDVLFYIKEYNIPIASVYGDIVIDYQDELNGQMTLCDYGLEEDKRPLKTSGCKRTGCMFCGYGCHLEQGEGRFEKMKETHPKIYDYIMRPEDQGGLNFKEVIDWLNEHGDLHIKY